MKDFSLKIKKNKKLKVVVMDWCCMCNEETTNHLLLLCSESQELLVHSLFEVHWVMLRSVVELLAS